MKKLILASIVAVVGVLLFLVEFKSFDKVDFKAESSQTQPAKLKMNANYGRLPMHFEPNQGQVAEDVEFVSRGRGYTLFLTPTAAVLTLRKSEIGERKLETEELQAGHSSSRKSLTMPSLKAMASFPPEPQNKRLETRNSKPETVLRMQLVGANSKPEVEGLDELPGKSNYFIGKDPKQWPTNVPNYARVQYQDIYPGVDLLYYGNSAAAGQLEYDFVVAPGADPEAITLAFEGTEELVLDADGNLRIQSDGSEVLLTAPVVYQEVQGSRKPVDGQYILLNASQVGIGIGEYDPHLPLVIDPVALVYSTFLGGDSVEAGEAITLDPAGNIYVTGITKSANFPSNNSIQPSLAGNWDAFVLKLDPTGSALLFSTYLGGDDDDRAHDIAVDASGNIYLTGETASSNFPTANAFQPGNSCGFACDGDIDDAFVTKLNPAGNTLVYSTFLGGFGGIDHHDRGFGIAVDSEENAYVTGETFTEDFPTTAGAYITIRQEFFSYTGRGDAFVTKFSPTGDTLYSTFLGEFSIRASDGKRWTEDRVDDRGFDIAVDSEGKAYVVGRTYGNDFPTTDGALQRTRAGATDAFVSVLNPAGSDLVHSTYLGGTDDEFEGLRIALDRQRNVYLTGETRSEDFPVTPGAFQETLSGGKCGNISSTQNCRDAFVAKLNASLSVLIYSTYLGGRGDDQPTLLNPFQGDDNSGDITVDDAGHAFVTGFTRSAFFPVHNGFQDTLRGPGDAFVAHFDETGARIYSTYLGGSSHDGGNGIVVDNRGTVYVTGWTTSPDFHLINPYDSTFVGFNEAFIVRIGQAVIPLIYNQVTMGEPPVFSRRPTTPQQILPQFLINAADDTLLFAFEGRSTDGKVGLRVLNTRVTSFTFPPLTLDVKIMDPDTAEIVPFSIPNIRSGDVGKQFDVTQDGAYLIKVFAEAGSPGPFPAPFQIHLAANVGLPQKLINGEPEVARGIRQDILFNHPAPRPQGLFGQDSSTAQTALFKFVNPVELSQFANAVIVPRIASGFPLAEGIVRAPDPMQPLSKATPTARTPVCTGQDATGMVVDFTQIPDPAEPGVSVPSVAGTVCAVIGENDATSVTLPLANGVTSLILDMGSGQEIVDGAGADFMVFSPAGSYTVAVSNTPYAGTFVPVGGAVSKTQSFDLVGTNLTSVRFVLVTAAPQVTLDAVKALNIFIDAIVQDPVTGSNILVGDVGFSTITMRRAKASETAIDPFLELIAPDGSNLGENESGFGDKTSQDLSDAALINTDLTQSGFWRFFGRGYDQIPSDQSFGAFFVRLESGGDYDADDIIVSEKDEENTVVQKIGSISGPRERDSYLFQWHPGQPIKIVVNATAGDLDPVIELHDPEGFLIAANDNFAGRGRNAVLDLLLPANTFNAEAVSPELPNPSTYRLVVSAVDPMRGPNDKHALDMGTAYFRGAASGDYEVKVFTGALTGGGAIQPTVVSVAPGIAVQGATNVALTITGSNFVDGAAVAFSGTGVTVTSVNFISASEIKAVIDIAGTAQPGLRDVIVNNPGGLSGAGTSLFEIRESLGTVTLQWEAPSSGETLAPPANLALQFNEGQGWTNVNSTLSERPLQAKRSFPTVNRSTPFNGRYGRVKKRGNTNTRLSGIKLQILQQPEELSNGTPVTRTVGTGEVQEFFINVPADAQATTLKFKTSNSTGDQDLFVRFGSPPDLLNGVFDFFSENIAPDEEFIAVDQTTVPSIQAGQWFVSVSGFAASTYTLTAIYSQPEALSNGVPVTRTIQQDESQEFFIPVPADATSLTVTTTNSTGDPDLFVRFGSPPDLMNSIFDFSSETVGPGEESITVDQSTNLVLQTGDWFVTIIEFESGQQTYTLTATHNGSGGGAQLLSYNVYRSTMSNARSTGTLVANMESSVTTFTDAVPNTGTFFYQVTAVYDQGESAPSNEATVLVTSVEDQHPDIIPVAFALKQNYPNPFNPETRIVYELPKSTHVQLEVFNLLGQKIRTLVDEPKPAGSYAVLWDGRQDNDEAVASGVYLYRLKTDDFVKSRKLLLLR